MPGKTGAVITAAGKGRRMGRETPKQFMNINGKSVILYSIEAFEECPFVDEVIITVSEEYLELCSDILKEIDLKKPVILVIGGDSRQESVFAGLRAAKGWEYVLIHDGARPFVTPNDIERSLEGAKKEGAAILALPVGDTVKIAENGIIGRTVSREAMYLAQTPQAFKMDLIMTAHQKAESEGFFATDDASIAENAGYQVAIVQGNRRNIKLTTPDDWEIAQFYAWLNKGLKEKKYAKTAPMKKVDIYTDGACSGNPGPGGYGAVILYNGKRLELSGGYRRTTNNRMEIMAVIKALEALKESCEAVVYSDSKYVVDAISLGWAEKWRKKGWMRTAKDKALNPDLWERLLILTEKHKVTFQWVKGHASNIENNRCDFLAVSAISSRNHEEDFGYYDDKK